MASANQIKMLVKHFTKKDDNRFLSVVLQIAAHEAKIGHTKFADELRFLVDKAKISMNSESGMPKVLSASSAQMVQPSSDLFSVAHPVVNFNNIVLSDEIKNKLTRFLDENRNSKKIRQFGLVPKRHLMLYGPPGTGKTMSASVVACELHLPLFIVRMDSLMTKYMGETSAKLRSIFDYISQHRGVYLFDEFDTIGSKRSITNDVGEVRRVLNTFLQLLDEHHSDSLIIAATNHKEILDNALYRRFDDVIEYQNPESSDISVLIESKFISFELDIENKEKLIVAADGLSYAEISKSCDDAMKTAIIKDTKNISQETLERIFRERKSYHI
ncbi:ATP-binding protein [Photobacterium sp. SP02]|uniref:AAA family ATPase n=1 Tax=Photobacterium sp. SP02 TaxID=3032280 RepID=UPI00314501D5